MKLLCLLPTWIIPVWLMTIWRDAQSELNYFEGFLCAIPDLHTSFFWFRR